MNSKDFGYNSRTCQHPIFPPEYTPVGCSCNTLGISCLNMNCSEPTCSFSTAVSRDWNSSSKYMYHKWKKTKHPCNIDHPYEYTDIVLVPQWYTCQLFPSHRCKILSWESRDFWRQHKHIQRCLKISVDIPRISEVIKNIVLIPVPRCVFPKIMPLSECYPLKNWRIRGSVPFFMLNFSFIG